MAVSGSTRCGTKADSLLGTLKLEVRPMIPVALHAANFRYASWPKEKAGVRVSIQSCHVAVNRHASTSKSHEHLGCCTDVAWWWCYPVAVPHLNAQDAMHLFDVTAALC